MLVGHNPGMADLVATLTGAEERFPTAALAHVRLTSQRWDELSGVSRGDLIDLWRPKEL
jgi:phosphohistidine phosphatase SixA